MVFFSRNKTETKPSLEPVLRQTHTLFVLADAALVAVQGREQMEQFLQSQGQQPTADIERFASALGLTPEEVKSYKNALKNRLVYSTVFSLKNEVRMLLELVPVENGSVQWALMMRPFLMPILNKASASAKPKEMKTGGAGEEQGWQIYLEHAPIPTVILSPGGQVQRCNAAFEKLLTRTYQGKKNWKFLDCVSASSKEAVAAWFMKAMDGKQNSGSLEVKLASNEECTLSMFLSRLEDAEGFIVQMIDLTEQKNLEMRFAHSQKMQAVGQLAGGIAHDFNNLLTAMIGFSDLLLMRHPAGDQSFADIMQIKQNANRAANLVRQLLAFSRKQTLKAEVVSITDTLADLANLIRRLIGENIAFKLQHGRDIWPVQVDQGQLEQVIINLAVNARDAMNHKGALTIRTENVTIDAVHPLSPDNIFPAEEDAIAEGEYVRIEVEDSGQGIAPELRRKIFEPFFSTKEVGAGTGLGLSTVYGIVKQTGGYICVRSEIGKGTCFTIFLKHYVATANESAADNAQELPLAQTENETSSAPMDLTGTGTILLVEDEAPVRIFSARALRNKGYNVLEADCADAAFKVIAESKGKLDLIITDVVMPGMTGPAMVEQISKEYPNINVIFISGYAEDAFVQTYGTARNFHFLPKPFSLKQLAAKVKEVIE